jgi:hypothetical protein
MKISTPALLGMTQFATTITFVAKKRASFFLAVFALLLSLGLAPRLKAQVVGATLSGTVTDPSGAALLNTEVSIRNKATGVTRVVVTNADGVYSAPNLTPGDYVVSAKAAGFATDTSNLTLIVGAQQTLNLTMRVGEVTEQIVVTGEAPSMNLTNSEIGGSVAETTVRELPLNGRSWSDLANLTPGVYSIHTQMVQARDLWSRGFGAQLTISGARPQQNNYRLDGVSVNDPTNGGPGSLLGGNMGVDAISEFSVLTTNYSTEYGRASGGIINATTKSGTNQFHGDAYEFLRNSALDAKNFFDPPGSIPPFRRNQFGASAGGPIQKDKTFIFGDYEGLRQFLSITQGDQVPSAAARAGFVSGVQLKPGPGTDANGVNLKVLPYLAFWPTSTVPNPNDPTGNTTIFTFARPHVTSENYFTIRADHRFSDKNSIYATYFYDYSNQQLTDEMKNKIETSIVHRQFATIEETHTFGSNLVNSARVGVNRSVLGGPFNATATNPLAADPALGFAPTWSAGLIQVNGLETFFGGLTAAAPQRNAFTSWQAYDDAFLTKGKHSLKFGVSVERIEANMLASPRPGGQWNFQSLASFLTNGDQTQAVSQGPVKLSTDLVTNMTTRDYRQTIFGVYLQDDFRLRPNLTINMGLRYEPATVPNEYHGRMGSLLTLNDAFPAIASAAQANASPATSCPQCGVLKGDYFHNNMLRNFDPRLGFAWDPFRNGKTSVRGGFGVYDQLVMATNVRSQIAGNYPYTPEGNNGNLPQGSFGGYSSFPGGVGSAFSLVAGNPDSKRAGLIERNPKRAYVMQWNLSVERELRPNLTMLLGYVGSHGVHGNTADDDVNMVPPTASPMGYLWPCETPALPYSPSPTIGNNVNACFGGKGLGGDPFSEFNTHVGRENAVLFRNSSRYDGMEFQLTKRMSHGFQIQGSFTWSKSLDTASAAAVGDQFTTGISSLFIFDPRLTRAPSDFNVGKVLSINYLWQIPTPNSFTGFARAALGGWQLGGLVSASSGTPFTPLLAGDALGLLNTDPFAFPDRLRGSGCGSPINPGNVSHYIKVQCFAIPDIVTFQGQHWIRMGNAGRNSIPGPGLESFDLSVVKNTRVPRISETFNVQFRVEAFNVFNRANFNPESTSTNNVLFDPTQINPAKPGNEIISGGGFGAADFTATTSRQIQVALKVIW